ncbi:MAG: hypothetical protein OJF47_002167 [Nitrospira sp.]|nr:MAG: hypothetical protein OJF47_002167 [Nitrospira sp.]
MESDGCRCGQFSAEEPIHFVKAQWLKWFSISNEETIMKRCSGKTTMAGAMVTVRFQPLPN